MAPKDLNARNNLIEKHLRSATVKLREELALFKQRSNSENYRLFCQINEMGAHSLMRSG